MPVVPHPGVPDLLALHAAQPQRYPYLLQSLGGGWDILFAFPQQTVLHVANPLPDSSAFLAELDAAWHSAAAACGHDPAQAAGWQLPFRGGWFVYLGYELLHELEPSVPRRHHGAVDFPLGCVARIPAAVLVNTAARRTFLLAEANHAMLLDTLEADLSRTPQARWIQPQVEGLAEEDPALFLAGVRRIKDYIRAGDVFQVNLARAWQARLRPGAGAADLYARLCARNPAPFAGIADFGGHQIISSSPERLVRVANGQIETRPIAGTHPRAPTPEEDATLRRDLLASPKERAEHIMLIDLERNDLGRICQPGSVEANELMTVQSYAHVHHIESNVRGRLRPGIRPAQVLRALFPGGTITGCPKVRTMQIIQELEAAPRFAYTGSMGYLNHDGSMDMNILIRTMMLSGQSLSFKAGAGIVADSLPGRELAETRAKAKGLLKALEY